MNTFSWKYRRGYLTFLLDKVRAPLLQLLGQDKHVTSYVQTMPQVSKTYDSRVVGNSFLNIALGNGDVIEPMKLLKLVYIAHGWYLALTKSPLISDEVEAWKYGPVIPKLYNEIKKFGARPISEYYTEFDFDDYTTKTPEVSDKDVTRFLEVMWKRYGKYSGIELSAMTHKKGTPWSDVYSPDRRHIVIPNVKIRSYYESLIRKERTAGV